MGLIGTPVRKNETGMRLYTIEQLAKVKLICRFRALGFSLENTKVFLELSLDLKDPTDDEKEIVREQMRAIESQIKDLKKLRKHLQAIVTGDLKNMLIPALEI